MAADICILAIHEGQGGFIQLNVLFWFTVAAPYPVPSAASSYPAIQTDPNTTGLLGQIQSGTVIEESNTFIFPTSWIANQWATAVEPLLLAYLNARKSFRNGTLASLPDPGLKYKVIHDSVSGWTA